VTGETFLEHVRQAPGVLAETRKGQVQVGADVLLVTEETGYSLWFVQQPKVVGCNPGVQALTVRRCALT